MSPAQQKRLIRAVQLILELDRQSDAASHADIAGRLTNPGLDVVRLAPKTHEQLIKALTDLEGSR